MVFPARRSVQALAFFLLGAVVFSLAYCQAPLYYSNQNQYFLHGLAQAGKGDLPADWLARTLDPTPLFTALVAFTARYLQPWLFHVYQGLCFGAYLAAMVGLFWYVAGAERAARRWPVFTALLVALHSGLIRWLSCVLLGQDYPWFLQAGVAGQYILGNMLQPSCSGVLLVVAISLFVHDWHVLAVGALAAAAILHGTYLLSAALVTLGFLTTLWLEKQSLLAILLGLLALLLVLPTVLHASITFGPTTPESFAQAQDILVNFRIPHHCRIDRWLDGIAALQVGWIVLAVFLVRQEQLSIVLVIPFVIGTALTLLQGLTGSPTLALLFPWRISSVLVPIATTVVLSRLAASPRLPLGGAAGWVGAGLTTAVFVAGGVWLEASGKAFQASRAEEAVMEYVRAHHAAGEVYLVPVFMPDPAKARRASPRAGEFKPLAIKLTEVKQISLDFDSFRLKTGAAIFVDFKSIPYKDVEVVAWYDRLREAYRLEKLLQEGEVDEAIPHLRRLGISHFVVPAGPSLQSADLEKLHEDECYRLYRLKQPGVVGR